MNEPQLPVGPVRSQLVRSSWVGFLATTIALMLLASGGTAYLVNIGTGHGFAPRGLPLSISASPAPLAPTAPQVVIREVAPLTQTRTVTQSAPQIAPPPARPVLSLPKAEAPAVDVVEPPVTVPPPPPVTPPVVLPPAPAPDPAPLPVKPPANVEPEKLPVLPAVVDQVGAIVEKVLPKR